MIAMKKKIKNKRILVSIPENIYNQLEDHLWANKIKNRTQWIIGAIERMLKK